MAAKPKGRGTVARPQQDMCTLTGLDQVKVLADPLRIRILEAFLEERTTKQVAELLGEKPTKLYHHVDALERVGLISLVRTRQNRGTMEKYYLSVARAFRADARIFNAAGKHGSENSAALRQIITTIVDQTASELTALVDQAGNVTKGIEEEGIVSFLEIHGTKKDIREIRTKLRALIRSLTAVSERPSRTGGKEPSERYRLTLAYYPMIKPKRRAKSS